ncbi:MAG: LysE family transporter [Ignavibacteria bacterium]|nr:LysE family transporter [Ignavibacteria bacterium]
MLSLFAGVIIGIALAIIPGPAALTSIKLGLGYSSRHGYLAGLGIAFVDFIYCLFAVFTTSAILHLFLSFSNNYPTIILLIQFLIVIALVGIGVLQLRGRINVGEQDIAGKGFRFLDKLSDRGPFFIGVGIALANAINPTFLPSLGYVTLHIQKFGIIESSTISHFLFSLGFGLGNLIWLSFLVKVFVAFKPRMSQNLINRIHKFAGLTLIGFGTFLGYRVLEISKLSELLRFVFAF